MAERIKLECKDCGKPVFVTEATQTLDVARGLSAPERCPKHRRENALAINKQGQSYWEPKKELDPEKRCWGKFGLGRLERDRAEPEVQRYNGIPVEFPLLAAEDPDDPRITEQWRELAIKFSKIAPIAQELVDKILSPQSPRVFVLVGPTGTGKSTWVPYRLLRSRIGETGRIVVTQPRTITLRAERGAKGPPGVPGYIASRLMGLPDTWIGPGQEVGLQYSGVYDNRDSYTRLLFVTDGTLINMIRSGDIGNFRLIMIDEAHEQSRNMELIFALLKHRMALYPQLKLLIASATIDVDKFTSYFGDGKTGGVCVVPADPEKARAAGTLKVIHDRFMEGSVDSSGAAAPGLDWSSFVPESRAIGGMSPFPDSQLDGRSQPYQVGDLVLGYVTKVTDLGIFVKLGGDLEGLIDQSELAEGEVDDLYNKLRPGQKVEVRVFRVDTKNREIGIWFVHADFEEDETPKDQPTKPKAEAKREMRPRASKAGADPQHALKERLTVIPRVVAALVEKICEGGESFTKLGMPRGDILVFLPRIDDIEETERQIVDRGLKVAVYKCHAQVESFAPYDESDKRAEAAMAHGQPTNPQRVILATNYAETSVTMSNLRYVIDSGLIVQSGWNSTTCSVVYKTEWHSQAGCKQRKGRVGRVQEGECFRLYTKAEHDAMPKDTPPEVTRIALDTFLMEAKASGIEDLDSFDWLGKAQGDPGELKRAKAVLSRTGVLDHDGDMTHRGIEFSGFRVASVDLALCISESEAFACTLEAATFMAFAHASGRLFVRGDRGALAYMQWRHGCYDDVDLYLRVAHAWSDAKRQANERARELGNKKREETYRKFLNEWSAGQGLSAEVLVKADESRNALLNPMSRKTHDNVAWRELDLARLHRVRLLLARCLSEWIYVRDPVSGAYVPHNPSACPCPGEIRIDSGSAGLSQGEMEAFVCVGRMQMGSGVFAQHIVRVEKHWIDRIKSSPLALAQLLREYVETESRIAETTARIVTQEADTFPPVRVAKGSQVAVTVVRPVVADASGAEKAYICEDKHGTPFIGEIMGAFQPGTRIKAEVVDASGARIKLSQEPIINELVRSEAVSDARVIKIEDFGVFVVLEHTGVSGILRKRNVGFAEWQELTGSTRKRSVRVVLVEDARDKWKLVTEAVYQARNQDIPVGRSRSATVVETAYRKGEREGEVSGLRLELLPGRYGFLHKGALGAFAESRMRTMVPGRRVEVVVEREGNNDSRDFTLGWPSQTFHVGDSVEGYVEELGPDSTGRGVPWAKVEFAPRVRGRIFWRNAPYGAVNGLYIGQRVRAEIIEIDLGLTGKTRYKLRME